MKLNTLSTRRIRITFSKDPFTVKEIVNLLTGRVLVSGGLQTILVRTRLELFEPTIVTRLRRYLIRDSGAEFSLSDDTGKYQISLFVVPSDGGIKFLLKAKAPQPIWLVEWRLSGWKCDEVILPALGGQCLTKDMPAETTLSYKYPFWWNAQFLIGSAARGGVWICSKETEPRLKLARVRRESGSFTLTYGFEANAPLTSHSLEAEWYVDAYSGDWRVPVNLHRLWMEDSFGLTLLESNLNAPPWLRDIHFVLEMWGVTKERPEPLHTFEMMTTRLREWKKLYSPKNTLVYIPGYAMHGIDSHAPDYFPSKLLGGESKFKKFVKAAHAMGYRVMIHTNVLAMTFTHRLYRKFRKHQVIDAFDRPQGWGLDMDGDWLAEPYFAYINPGAAQWGELMEDVIGNLIRKYDIDAVFLDQTLLAFNVSKGPNFLVGMRNHIKRLQSAFPSVLFAGEGLHEQVVSALPFAQIHGIDSITEVHGLDGAVAWRKAHPVSTYLFGPYTKFVAHLLTKHPSHPLFKLQEQAYAHLGVLPALCLYDHTQPMDMPQTRAMIRRARQLQKDVSQR